MSDAIGFVCLGIIFGSGVAVGYFVAWVKYRKPKVVFQDQPAEVDGETAAA